MQARGAAPVIIFVGPSIQPRLRPHSLTSLPDRVQGTNRVVLKVSFHLAMLIFTVARPFWVKDQDDLCYPV